MNPKTAKEIYNLTMGEYPMEKCERLAKEACLNAIHHYCGYLTHLVQSNLDKIPEEHLRDMVSVAKMFAGAQESYMSKLPKTEFESALGNIMTQYGMPVEAPPQTANIKKDSPVGTAKGSWCIDCKEPKPFDEIESFGGRCHNCAVKYSFSIKPPTEPFKPCGGCGNDDPNKRCIGCLHQF